ncbi:hypothetical protein I1A49_05060 [Streptomyces malaysiensis subsp. malaysiensis]|uniref:Transposase n=1 Tax=Streptomyces malaysiensis TaxID=92644 RepID=A0ABX6VYJ2_STRMQ|nr:hypothetical protein [Streptomyces solisilvae]QPI54393.1 hypothetical protein I1A49_05060 [Streptomyces solisilvae]
MCAGHRIRRGASQRPDELATLQEALARIFVRGARVDWTALLAPTSIRHVELPTYAFQRQRYWLEAGGRWATWHRPG